jgi:hypothetical protein
VNIVCGSLFSLKYINKRNNATVQRIKKPQQESASYIQRKWEKTKTLPYGRILCQHFNYRYISIYPTNWWPLINVYGSCPELSSGLLLTGGTEFRLLLPPTNRNGTLWQAELRNWVFPVKRYHSGWPSHSAPRFLLPCDLVARYSHPLSLLDWSFTFSFFLYKLIICWWHTSVALYHSFGSQFTGGTLDSSWFYSRSLESISRQLESWYSHYPHVCHSGEPKLNEPILESNKLMLSFGERKSSSFLKLPLNWKISQRSGMKNIFSRQFQTV